MDRIAALVDGMFESGFGSAAACSIGDAGQEVGRFVRGHVQRYPAPGPAVHAGSLFDLASVTKPMATVAMAMVLVGDGRLDLEHPIRRWLPAAASAGTVRDLVGHAAGCIAHVEFFREMRVGAHRDPRAELVERAMAVPCGAPGIQTLYSDLGYLMLGAIVERAAALPLEAAFAELVAGPLALEARYGDVTGAVATELDERGTVCGQVHDENAFYGGRACGHAGLFATIDGVATFASAMIDVLAGTPRGRLRPDVVHHFVTSSAAPITTWRLGWDTPSTMPGVSHAGDRWPREHAIGHLGFTGTSVYLDLPRRRWVVLLTNRVHPTRHGASADTIKALRRAVHDAAIDMLDGPRVPI
ncbi:MAG: serine hydrolase domain-containing protein [Kofleriaceae bacterium]